MTLGHHQLKLLASAIEGTGMPVSNRHNAKFGYTDAALMVSQMCAGSMCAEGASFILHDANHGTPSADWLLGKIGNCDPEEMQIRCRKEMRRSAKRILCHHGTSRPIIAIDKTVMPRYDKNPDMKLLIKTNHGIQGTTTAESYITSKIVSGEIPIHLDFMRVTRSEFTPDFVEKLLKPLVRSGMKPSMVLADREFFSVDTMQRLSDMNLKFVIPAVRTPGIKKAMKEVEKGTRSNVSDYTIKSSEGKEFCFRFVVTEGRNEKMIPFATNFRYDADMLIKCIPEEYRDRWGIETGFKCVKQARPRTASRNESIRMFLFFMALLVYNIWVEARDSEGSNMPVHAPLQFKILISRMVRCVEFYRPKRPPDPG